MGKEKNSPEVSVIISIYNGFVWLEKVLDALMMQRFRDFEIVLADDGSNEETVANIRDYISRHKEIPIIHSWIEDKGWRKNIALNKAVRESRGEKLIYVDGDCIPEARFVGDHARLLKPGTVIGGRRVEMTPEMSRMVEDWKEIPSDFFSRLRKKALGEIFGGVKRLDEQLEEMERDQKWGAGGALRRTIRFPLFLSSLGVKDCDGFIGCNFSIYRKDLEAVNGFDERYLAPATGEDSDLGVRLMNNGIKIKKCSHYALMAHRFHRQLHRDSAENARLLEEAIKNKTTFVPTGLFKEGEK